MRLPRRVPWSSQKELLELHGMLWDDIEDEAARRRGLSRLSVYLSSPTCPAFMHLLQSLLVASLTPLSSRPDAVTLANTRLTYAMAIVRFVNGMVDPMQTGTYARSITQIAQQLGIPVELVQMRHQATHEDLPSLGVLRAGLWSCLFYLRDHAIGPLVFSAAGSASVLEASTSRQARLADMDRKLEVLLKRYKKLMKAYFASRTSKAAKSTGQAWAGGQELRRVMRELEDLWSNQDERGSAKEEAREVLVNKLVQVGSLVPLSRKKRPSHRIGPQDAVPGPTLDQQRLWKPLLQLAETRLYGPDAAPGDEADEEDSLPSLAQDLAAKIVGTLHSMSPAVDIDAAAGPTRNDADSAELDADFLMLPDSTETAAEEGKAEEAKERRSYMLSLTSWLVYFWNAPEDELALDEPQRVRLRKLALSAKGESLGLDSKKTSESDLSFLYSAIAAEDAVFAKALRALDNSVPWTPVTSDINVTEDDLAAMESRMASIPRMLENLRRERTMLAPSLPLSDQMASSKFSASQGTSSVPGWRRIDSAKWAPKPIGIWQEVV